MARGQRAFKGSSGEGGRRSCSQGASRGGLVPRLSPGTSAKRLSDGGHDKSERGEPTHSPDQQLRHAAVVPCCQRGRLIQGKELKEPVSKKEPRRRQRGSASPKIPDSAGVVPPVIRIPATPRCIIGRCGWIVGRRRVIPVAVTIRIAIRPRAGRTAKRESTQAEADC